MNTLFHTKGEKKILEDIIITKWEQRFLRKDSTDY